MATIRFGAKCDRCGVAHNDYSVGDIAWCADCGLEICDACAEKSGHVTFDRGEHGRVRNCPEPGE